MRVEWDPRKDRANRIKHGFGFDEVRPLFEVDATSLVIYDDAHSDEEDRFLVIGRIARGLVVVAHTEPSEDVVRIVSARAATPTEARLFHAHGGGRKR